MLLTHVPRRFRLPFRAREALVLGQLHQHTARQPLVILAVSRRPATPQPSTPEQSASFQRGFSFSRSADLQKLLQESAVDRHAQEDAEATVEAHVRHLSVSRSKLLDAGCWLPFARCCLGQSADGQLCESLEAATSM